MMKPQVIPDPRVFIKFIRVHKPLNRQVITRRLQILANGDHVDIVGAHVFHDLDDFLADRAAINPADVEQQLFQSNWYVPIDENLVVMPNRNPPPDFYFR